MVPTVWWAVPHALCLYPSWSIYLRRRKELLWPHIREFADRGISHAKDMLHRLHAAGEPCQLFVIHGHYADAGETAAMMASTLAATEEVDMVLTGHSLGRNKQEHLLASGGMGCQLGWVTLGPELSLKPLNSCPKPLILETT
jgi:hypothetical protein